MQEEIIERLCAEYADAYDAGAHPNAAHYLAAYPGLARELAAFFVYFHTIEVDLPAVDATPAETLSPAALAVQARIRREQTSALN